MSQYTELKGLITGLGTRIDKVQADLAALKRRPAPAGGRTHRVVSGDTLSSIAQKYYGDASRWREIHGANAGIIANPDVIRVGQVLTIP